MYKNVPGKVYVKTFDGFDLYSGGELVYFSSAKSKEFLAYLVDRKGKYATLSQLADTLFENEMDKVKAKKAGAHSLQPPDQDAEELWDREDFEKGQRSLRSGFGAH